MLVFVIATDTKPISQRRAVVYRRLKKAGLIDWLIGLFIYLFIYLLLTEKQQRVSFGDRSFEAAGQRVRNRLLPGLRGLDIQLRIMRLPRSRRFIMPRP